MVAVFADVRQIGQAADIDQYRRLCQTQLHQRQEAVAARNELGLVAVLADEADCFFSRFGAYVVELCGDHWLVS